MSDRPAAYRTFELSTPFGVVHATASSAVSVYVTTPPGDKRPLMAFRVLYDVRVELRYNAARHKWESSSVRIGRNDNGRVGSDVARDNIIAAIVEEVEQFYGKDHPEELIEAERIVRERACMTLRAEESAARDALARASIAADNASNALACYNHTHPVVSLTAEPLQAPEVA